MEDIMIDLLRLDERLIHGQVAAAWCKNLNCDTLLVIDNAAAADQFITNTLYMAAPANMKTFVMNVEKALNVLCDERSKTRHIFVVMRHIDEFVEVASKAPDIKQINVANYGKMSSSSKERKHYTSNLFLNEDELSELKKVLDLDIPSCVQMTPQVEKIPLDKVLANEGMTK